MIGPNCQNLTPSVQAPDLAAPRVAESRWGGACLALFLFAWILPGLVGRDPWKADEAYSFGMVLEMLDTGNWTIPTLAGEPFMEKPPILYIVSALSARLLSPILPLHDAARGSVVVFNLLTFLCLGGSARLLYGPGKGWLGPLLLISAIGLIHNQHMLITDVALLTGFAMGHLGLVLSHRCFWAGGLIAGTGMGLAFLSKGLLGPGLLGLTALALPVFRPWRTANFFKTLLVAGVAFLPWAVIWPYLVYRQSPALFHEWFWVNNIGRFTGNNGLGPKTQSLYYFRLLPWFGFPTVFLAVWAWWRERDRWRASISWQLGVVSVGVILLVLSVSRQGRSLYAQPMLIPLALAGVPAVLALNGRLAWVWSRLNGILFAVAAIGGWLAWGAITGLSRGEHWVQTRVPGFASRFYWFPTLVAVLATILLVRRLWRSDKRSGRDVLIDWAAVLGYTYLIAMTLFLPISNTNMGYRPLFSALRAQLPPDAKPIASLNLGEPQRGLLHYLAGLKTRRIEVDKTALDEADWVLIQGDFRSGFMMQPPARGNWKLHSEWRRGGRESFRLYQRQPVGNTPPVVVP